MWYLTGANPARVEDIAALDADWHMRRLGLLVQPGTSSYARHAPSFPLVGIDNGCFSAVGRARFSERSYGDLIDDTLAAWGDDCVLFATAPDVVGDWRATLQLAERWLPWLRRTWGVAAAIVLQEGAYVGNVPWQDVDAVFVGGMSAAWKTGDAVRGVLREARRRGMWRHMGRVNSARRFRAAAALGCDSADGTFLRFSPPARMLEWLDSTESST